MSIAAASGSSISLEELFLLLPESMTDSSESLARFIAEDELLRSELIILGGEIAPRGVENLVDHRMVQKDLSADRVELAKAFLSRLPRFCRWIRLAGVSGSAAFDGWKPGDDIDLFLIVERRRLWITLLLALTKARVDRLRDGSLPVFCFNRTLDEDRAVASFRQPQDPLFARETLSLKVAVGGYYYHSLLTAATWMEGIFPRLYRSRLAGHTGMESSSRANSGFRWSVVDAIAYLMLGPYLLLVNLMRNRKLEREGRNAARFRTIVRRNLCAYESRKYDDLSEQYRSVF